MFPTFIFIFCPGATLFLYSVQPRGRQYGQLPGALFSLLVASGQPVTSWSLLQVQLRAIVAHLLAAGNATYRAGWFLVALKLCLQPIYFVLKPKPAPS